MIGRLEAVLERLEAALAARETENQRLRKIEAAATEALADLDALLGDGDSASSDADNDDDAGPAAPRGFDGVRADGTTRGLTRR